MSDFIDDLMAEIKGSLVDVQAHPNRFWHDEKELDKWLDEIELFVKENTALQQKQACLKTAQECYLECLAVECGEGECARAIRMKFDLPKVVAVFEYGGDDEG